MKHFKYIFFYFWHNGHTIKISFRWYQILNLTRSVGSLWFKFLKRYDNNNNKGILRICIVWCKIELNWRHHHLSSFGYAREKRRPTDDDLNVNDIPSQTSINLFFCLLLRIFFSLNLPLLLWLVALRFLPLLS